MANGHDGGSAVPSGYHLDTSRLHVEPIAHDERSHPISALDERLDALAREIEARRLHLNG